MTPDTIRDLRARLSLTQRQLAERVHVSVNTVIAWEHGTRAPGAGPTARMARMLQPGHVRAATLTQSLHAAAELADANAQADIAAGDPESAEVAMKTAEHLRRLATTCQSPGPCNPMQVEPIKDH